MPRFLSAEWVADVQTAAARDERLRAATADVNLSIEHLVTGGPNGDAAFHLVIDRGAITVRPGPLEGATVTLESDYDTAAAVSQGEESAQRALMHGRLHAHGDLAQLVAYQNAFAGIDDVLRSVRESTVY